MTLFSAPVEMRKKRERCEDARKCGVVGECVRSRESREKKMDVERDRTEEFRNKCER